MKIGLWSDCHNFPSVPLMKLSAYHKSIGDEVERYDHTKHYDLVYASKVFSFSPDIDSDYPVQADEVRKGGTGYCISVVNGREVYDKSKDSMLPKEVEHIYPDYSLYPNYNYAVGFLTRGCPRQCGFCVVGKKEGC
ncbi:MAG: radical SAM protein, partial [Clostridia bacterium]|nr:radical SAM protein [Clostridia bacterium]